MSDRNVFLRMLAPLLRQQKSPLAGGLEGDQMKMVASIADHIKPKAPDTTEYVLNSMIAKSSNGIVMMPPGIAKNILEELNFPGQRERKPRRMHKAIRRIESGTWRAFPISFVKLKDGRFWLIDGQHRLDAIAQCGVSQPMRIIIDEVLDEEEARRRYAGHDEADSVRNVSEVLDAVGAATSLGLKRQTTYALFRALPILLNRMEPSRGQAISNAIDAHSVDSRLEEIVRWKKEAAIYERALEMARPSLRAKMVGAGCFAVALYTLRHQTARGVEFWSGVAENNELKRTDPRAVLISDMTTRRLNSGSSRQGVQQPVLAWNAWNEGRDLRIIKCIEGAPIVIWGTPLARGRQ